MPLACCGGTRPCLGFIRGEAPYFIQLKYELETFTYSPAPLTTFIIRDPKIRRISASHFRDRVVHHALCNVIAPIFEKDFIYDSFANQKGKGTHLAIKRIEKFMRKVRLRREIQEGGGDENSFQREVVQDMP